MPGPTTKLTTREKAAVLLYVAGICDDWTEIYIAAEDKKLADAGKTKYIFQAVSHWKNSDKIKKLIAEYNRIFADRDADARQQGRQEEKRQEEERRNNAGDSDRTETQQPRPDRKPIDYYNPENQKNQINRIIQESADDPKTQLDAIKTIQQTQRDDKQAAREGRQVRAYLPQRCNTCPLYEKARRKPTK